MTLHLHLPERTRIKADTFSRRQILFAEKDRKFVGKKFGRLLVLDVTPHPSKITHWVCECECNTRKTIPANSVKRGEIVSCGCFKASVGKRAGTKHGMRYTPEYKAWRSLRQRCNRKNDISYKNYGGRGIRVCERWATFEVFYSDMGLRPSPAHSLDRIDNDGDYYPENCRWATKEIQAANRRVAYTVAYNDERSSLRQVYDAQRRPITYDRVYNRISRSGWDVERALTTPLKGGN